METEFKLPELGENIHEGKVVSVLVSVGDLIDLDQPVLEVETDKALIEVPSTVKGKVKAVHLKPGDDAGVGQTILTVDAGDGAAEPSPPPAREAAAEPPPAEATSEAKPEAAKEMEAPAPAAEAPPPPAAAAPAPPPARVAAPPAPAERAGAPAAAAPSVRRLAREIGVDIHAVAGTGPMGRISAEDVKRTARDLLAGAASTAPPAGAPALAPPLPDFSKWGEVERREMDGVRRATARHLGRAWSLIPHVTQCDLADITELEQLRKRYAPRAEAVGGKLTVTAILLKVAAAALKVFPQFNASVDAAADAVIYKKYCHIGVAVDTERGLLVPVVRDADRKNIIELSGELTDAAERARGRKTTLEEMQGGCFTITNLGGIGGTYFTPVVNWPEVAILGVSRGRMEPVYVDGEFRPRLMLPLSLSYDHRLIDGADAIRFLRWVCEALENPFLLSLEG